ncbi:alpha/beta hydrolase [Acaryochloris marina]|uniref:AB hydrolase-1 domain-containing protein n=1 Tax=Acaryochloris marina (strain MBIC 11017) TaxID=329726 RepID=B0C0J1_ACAM1|nr:alpha/beta fold hydrolase [Acaryochloris marina]ABW30784.1 hypothetical protein AM1_5843 [Acaryochloris marina MBIC11017]BDM79542.1 alpha/beta hydrolase [Acaryochloris marina MBIC10699]
MKRIFESAIATVLALGTIQSAEAAQVKRVTFDSQGQALVGHLYLPDNYQEGQQLPGVVVTGSWTSVKEQMAGTYASELADRGYASLAFDFRGWGESQDTVKFLEDPKRKTEDIIAAAEFLTTRPEVNPDKVGGLGICASAGYIADAALTSDAIHSVALVAPWLHNAEIVKTVYGGSDGVTALLETGRKAKAKFQSTGEMSIVPAASDTDKTAIMQEAPYYTDPERGSIPEYDNQFNLATWEPWLTYDALQTATQLKKPTLLVHSESAAIPQGAQEFAQRMGDMATTVWLENVTQFDFYDNPTDVAHATKEVDRHFQATL